MIGVSCESNGLYHLLDHPHICTTTDPPILIHAQLGHPSLVKLQNLVQSLSSYPLCLVSRVNLENILIVHFMIESVVKQSHLLPWTIS